MIIDRESRNLPRVKTHEALAVSVPESISHVDDAISAGSITKLFAFISDVKRGARRFAWLGRSRQFFKDVWSHELMEQLFPQNGRGDLCVEGG